MHNVKNRRERGQKYCHLSEKAEEDQKEAKEAAVLSNAPIAGRRCREIRQKGLLAVYLLLSLN
jgi:hypothetical protein